MLIADSTTPLGEVALKKLAGNAFGAEALSGTPSQLISRRPLPNEPAWLGLRVPRSARKASTAAWIAAGLAPAASRTVTTVDGSMRSSSCSTISRHEPARRACPGFDAKAKATRDSNDAGLI